MTADGPGGAALFDGFTFTYAVLVAVHIRPLPVPGPVAAGQ
ncbi:hypothetical protein ACFVZR_33310 [Streptomyces sp. NPDC058316]